MLPDVASLDLAAISAALRQVEHLEEQIIIAGQAEAVDREIGMNEGQIKEPENIDPKHGSRRHHSSALEDLDQQRMALRARATELWRRDMQSINILDLPMDILRQIFDEFQDHETEMADIYYWSLDGAYGPKDRRTTVQCARLTCRAFNELASPFLCPFFIVSLNQASLDRFEEMSKKPQIAAGIRGIQVELGYRPKELAIDVVRFKDARKIDLNQRLEHCCDYAENWEWEGMERSDRTYQECRHAIQNCRAMFWAWDIHLREAGHGSRYEKPPIDKDGVEYQQTFRQCYEKYQHLHEEQLRLVTDGSFVRIVAASIARLNASVSLIITDRLNRPLEGTTEHSALTLNSREELVEFMVSPYDWETIEELHSPAQITPAKILTELPIACHNLKAGLRRLALSCFPVRDSFSMLCPSQQTVPDAEWTGLQAAFQQLEGFEFRGGSLVNRRILYENIAAEKQVYVNRYLGAVFSSANLENLELSMRAFTLCTHDRQDDGYRLDSVLQRANWPRIRTVTICNVSTTQRELEDFCQGLGYSLEILDLTFMNLVSGSWSDTLDILRKKVGTRWTEQKCRVVVGSLTGGEFGPQRPDLYQEQETVWNMDDYDEERDPFLVVASQTYIRGFEGLENPLRQMRENL